ncbi:MAG: hypothetical protein JSR33_12590 [Proteobacteria bacterium]|nr:hypothetical protein [Pseudomonadota bacterium]
MKTICFKCPAMVWSVLPLAVLFINTNAFAKTIAIACPTVKTTLHQGYKIKKDGLEWSSWQSQPNLAVSTKDDKNYFSEISQSYKGISLGCIGGTGNKRYGFYVHTANIASCKIDSKTNRGFICELKA